jgi:hypothetical protein
MRSDHVSLRQLARAALRAARFLAVLLIFPLAANAHGLLLDADTDGQVITGRVYYTNGDIAVGESLELRDLSTVSSAPVPSKTDGNGTFSFPVTAGHRYRVSAYGEEGHTVDVEIDAVAKARPTLVETDTSAKEESLMPPAWAVVGGLLVLSLVPVLLKRVRRAAD